MERVGRNGVVWGVCELLCAILIKSTEVPLFYSPGCGTRLCHSPPLSIASHHPQVAGRVCVIPHHSPSRRVPPGGGTRLFHSPPLSITSRHPGWRDASVSLATTLNHVLSPRVAGRVCVTPHHSSSRPLTPGGGTRLCHSPPLSVASSQPGWRDASVSLLTTLCRILSTRVGRRD